MKSLHFDCFAGASGNMVLGALIALGVDRDALVAELSKLGLPEFGLEIETVDRSGISSTHVNVVIPDEKAHRHLHHIVDIIQNSSLSDSIKQRSIAIFTKLAEAEAKVHGTDIQKVHFHEVGALDAIIDIVGSCIGFEMLGIERFTASKLHVGSGFVDMAHGKFPVPPPAVAEIVSNIPIYSTEIEGELLTPTGAAIMATVCSEFGKLPEMKVEKSGYGAGTREYKGFPNVLRLMIGESTAQNMLETEQLTLIETNIDDATPQVLGHVMDRTMTAGALDCWFTPIMMKKNRPATMLSVLCEQEIVDEIRELLYTETPTLGLRITETSRESLAREIVKVKTKYGEVTVKTATLNGKLVNVKPEYEDVRRLAIEHRVTFETVSQEARLSINKVKTVGA
ncbi:MAG: nickel pincer cofactor biosynthesis protein LarC [Blastocatellia bacterium]|nr:nickel pincer cofactor biosynthesis protein LarC [Blastocatellia bacterium]